MKKTVKQISKNGVLGLLGDLEAAGCVATVYVSPETLAERDYVHLLPKSDPQRSVVVEAIDDVGDSDTGVAIFMAQDRTVVIQPPVPLEVDVTAAGMESEPLSQLMESEPVIGIVLLRLGRYAIGVLKGTGLLATKTDSRYMKNRHRAGGQSQRRFQRSRERLIRELYDKTCEMTQTIFEPHLSDIEYVMLGGERNTLRDFVRRCRLMQDLEPKTLSRLLPVDQPNQKALKGISYEAWKSRVSFFEY